MNQELNTEFTAVDINEFFDSNETGESLERSLTSGIVVLTPKQQVIIDELSQHLALSNPERKDVLSKRMENLRTLAGAIAKFPSLLERTMLTAEIRTPQNLIESLIYDMEDGEMMIRIPSKATLGKGFLVAKLHTFASLVKLAKSENLDEKLVQAFNDETVSMMFLLLAEDVYMNLVKDKNLEDNFRRQIATSLLLLWEHRADQNISDIAPVLQSVWKARRTLAPAFGTMMGTSELIMISFSLGEQWSKFIRTKLSESDVNQAMEEFLFGISYEQISKLRNILREKGIAAIGRDEVSKFLGKNVKTDVSMDYRDFFTQYSIRRDNASTRLRLDLEGPHRTLEDHFIKFVMELDKEKQSKDNAAR